MRRIPLFKTNNYHRKGTTSACAENTPPNTRPQATHWNYLRVRGEYLKFRCASASRSELPPRARRIQLILSVAPAFGELPPRARRIHTSTIDVSACCGTTSACAENTPRCDRVRLEWRNYLRVRGEYSNAESKGTTSAELPPRARRILGRTESKIRLIGTTSACAENTYPHHHQCPWGWNYLRVRGEYAIATAIEAQPWELPPRARRIRF